MVLLAVVGLGLAWVYGHVVEYAIHRWLLHPFGFKKDHMFAFHFREHHRNCRRQNMHDIGSRREALWVTCAVAIHLPLLLLGGWFIAGFVLGLVLSGLSYIRVHRKAHKNPAWALQHATTHYAHHMGKNQHLNWGVRSDWVDRALGTRATLDGKKY